MVSELSCRFDGAHSTYCVLAGQEMHAVHYEPPRPRPMVRPAYLHFIPSPAALSFNFAVQQYQSYGVEGKLIPWYCTCSNHLQL